MRKWGYRQIRQVNEPPPPCGVGCWLARAVLIVLGLLVLAKAAGVLP